MKILFAIAVLSFAALVWAALAIVRHVRKNSGRAAAIPAFDTEMAEAIDNRLSEIARPATRKRRSNPAADTEDFSYFHRDPAPSRSENQPFAEPPIKPAIVDQP
jgi:hypothetical protein